MLDWHKIETALVTLARDWPQGYLYEGDKTGDKSVEFSADQPLESLNLTELAKDLAKELER